MAELTGHLQIMAGTLRIGGAYGEPYSWGCGVLFHSPTEVEILGVVRAPTPSEWRASKRVLGSYGVTTIRFTRKREHGRADHEVPVTTE